jgi:hypothetical protein
MSFFTFSLIYLCKLESQKVFVHFTDVMSSVQYIRAYSQWHWHLLTERVHHM